MASEHGKKDKPYVGDYGEPIEGVGRIASASVSLVVLACLIGFAVGVVVWGALTLSNLLIHLLWHELPATLPFEAPWLPLALCPLGGLIIGLWTRTFHNAPESLDAVMETVRATGGYRLKGLGSSIVSFLLPLTFGGSVGPEAGLTGIIAAACTWIGNTLKRAGLKVKAVADLTLSATLSAVFGAPLLGIVLNAEEQEQGHTRAQGQDQWQERARARGRARAQERDSECAQNQVASAASPSPSDYTFRRPAKLLLYTAAAFGAFGGAVLVGSLLGGSAGLPRFSSIGASGFEYAWTVPLALAGWLLGLLFHGSSRLFRTASRKFKTDSLAPPLLAGVVMGALATALPDVLFSGEEQCFAIMENWALSSAFVLLLTGVLKVALTSLCLNFGWRGGNFFPCIFAGVSFGYGASALLGIDPLLCVTSVTTALIACMTRKPLLSLALLLLCFPVDGLLVSGIAAIVGAALPVPRAFQTARKADESRPAAGASLQESD